MSLSPSLSTVIIVAIALVAGGNPVSPPISCSPTAIALLPHPTSAAKAMLPLVASVSTAFAPSVSKAPAEPEPARAATSATSPGWPIAAVVRPYSPRPTCTSTKSVQTVASRPSPCAPVDLTVMLLALVLMALSGAIVDVTDSDDRAPRSRTPIRRRGRLAGKAFVQGKRRAAARRPPWRP